LGKKQMRVRAGAARATGPTCFCSAGKSQSAASLGTRDLLGRTHKWIMRLAAFLGLANLPPPLEPMR
jgi:hypothetical protein